MKPRFKVSRAGMELIKTFEGYRRSAAQLSDGRWTIGYGHTKTARKGAEVSEDDAGALLQYDLIEVAATVNDLTFTPLTQNQFDALVSFAFNVGLGEFRRSMVLRRVNEGSMLQAAWSLEMWRKADFEGERIVVDALVRRRAAEKALFLTPTDGWVAAPSPVLPPRFDADAGASIPDGRPVELKASLEGDTATVAREETPIAEAVEAAPVALAPVEREPVPVPTAAEPAANPAQAETVWPLSQIEGASEVLSARLEILLPNLDAGASVSETRTDLDLPTPMATPTVAATGAPAQYPDAVPTPADEPDLFERPKTELPWSNPIAYVAPEPDEYAEPSATVVDLFQRPIYREQTLDDHPSFDGQEVQPAKFGFAPYLALAVLGLVVFAAATTWAFSARVTGGSINPMAIGVPLALAGVACVAWSVYTLISRFSGNED